MDECDLLDEMAFILKAKGWTQDELIRFDENDETIVGVCMQGACSLATEDVADHGWLLAVSTALRLEAVIRDLYPDRQGEDHVSPWSTVVTFNDHPDTTFEDVLLVIKHAREMP